MPDQDPNNHVDTGLDLTALSQLIEKSQNGNDQARERLLEQIRNYLALMANKHMDFSLQGKAGPSDVVQQSMAQVFENLGQFRGNSEMEFRAWLKTIVVNEMRKMQRAFRAGKRDIGREHSIETKATSERKDVAIDNNLTPSSAAISAEKIQNFYRILGQLPKDYAEVIRWRSIEQLSFSDIADRMNRTENAVSKLWCRAVLQLEERLREDGDQFVDERD